MAADHDDELRTKVRPPRAPAMTVAHAFEVVVLEGRDAGARHALDAGGPARTLVGTSPICGMRLSDPHVSRRHATLHHPGGAEVRITDLSSTNGTFVNGARVADAFLRGEETVRIGDTTLRLELVDASRQIAMSTATAFGRVLGVSTEMRRLYPILELLAASDVPVVVEGETGTGKELVAEALHAKGPRASGPFVVLDAAGVGASSVEAELFGSERGAAHARKGLFELAHGGTLFIDEIADLELGLQPKLLRAIERAQVRRVGGDKWIPIDVRVVAATRRNLDAEVQAGRFRDDLYFRLAVARVELPPLRARVGDVTLLANHFWKELGGRDQPLPDDLIARYESYAWPGNVRELYNEVTRIAVLGDAERAARASVGDAAPPSSASRDFLEQVLAQDLPLVRARERVVDEFQRRYVERVLAQHGGNVTRAAAASGIAHRYFQLLRARQQRERD